MTLFAIECKKVQEKSVYADFVRHQVGILQKIFKLDNDNDTAT